MRWCRQGGMEGRRLSTNQTAWFCQLDQWRGCEGASGTITLYCAIDMLVLPNIQGSFYWPWSVKKGFRPSSFIKTNAKAANSCSMLSKLLQAFDSWQWCQKLSKLVKLLSRLLEQLASCGCNMILHLMNDRFNGKISNSHPQKASEHLFWLGHSGQDIFTGIRLSDWSWSLVKIL